MDSTSLMKKRKKHYKEHHKALTPHTSFKMWAEAPDGLFRGSLLSANYQKALLHMPLVDPT